MSRIRINELARELEVKPSLILRMLPDVGVTDKRTHSSSIDRQEANKVRQYFRRQAEGEPEPAASAKAVPQKLPAEAPGPEAVPGVATAPKVGPTTIMAKGVPSTPGETPSAGVAPISSVPQ